LENDYLVKVNYTTVWKAKQRAMKELYSDWANNFRMLYSFKAEVEKRSPGCVVEIDTEVAKDGKVYFSKFFMALKPCIDGFKAGCHPYLSIDSSFLTGKWNGQLASCNALDGYNWMFNCYWHVSIRDRGFMDMVYDVVEKMLRASVTFGSSHICM
jgi:hypothetical protein